MGLRKAAIVLTAVATLCSLYFGFRIHVSYRDSTERVSALVQPAGADQDRVALRQAIDDEDRAWPGSLVFACAAAYGVVFLFLTLRGAESVPLLLLGATPIMALILVLCHALTPLAVLGLVAAFSGFTGAGVLLLAHDRRGLA